MAEPMQAVTEEIIEIELEETEQPNSSNEVVVEQSSPPESIPFTKR